MITNRRGSEPHDAGASRLRLRRQRRPSRASAADATEPGFHRPSIVLLVLPAALGVAVYFSLVLPEPDAGYYAGGVGLFPSPIGTLVGTVGGYAGLTVFNAVAAFALLAIVGLVARQLGHGPLLAQALALLLFRGGWFQTSAMDAPGAALLLAALLLDLRGRTRRAAVATLLAAATHLATVPLALGAMVARRPRARATWCSAAVLLAAGAASGLSTGYRAGFRVIGDPHSFVEGAHELLQACWPLALLAPIVTVAPRMRPYLLGAAAGAIVAGAVPASVGQVGLTKYAVPCLFVAAPALRLSLRVRFDARPKRFNWNPTRQ